VIDSMEEVSESKKESSTVDRQMTQVATMRQESTVSAISTETPRSLSKESLDSLSTEDSVVAPAAVEEKVAAEQQVQQDNDGVPPEKVAVDRQESTVSAVSTETPQSLSNTSLDSLSTEDSVVAHAAAKEESAEKYPDKVELDRKQSSVSAVSTGTPKNLSSGSLDSLSTEDSVVAPPAESKEEPRNTEDDGVPPENVAVGRQESALSAVSNETPGSLLSDTSLDSLSTEDSVVAPPAETTEKYPDMINLRPQESTISEVSSGPTSGASFSSAATDDSVITPPRSPQKEQEAVSESLEVVSELSEQTLKPSISLADSIATDESVVAPTAEVNQADTESKEETEDGVHPDVVAVVEAKEEESEGKETAETLDTGATKKGKPSLTIITPEEPKMTSLVRSGSSDEDDVASKAAVALAAVAAAATANNKSPAEAAREARAVAQTFISSAADDSPEKKTVREELAMRTVKLSDVKTHLRQRALETGSAVMDKLCQGENDPFLHHLLLLEYFRCVDDTIGKEEDADEDEKTAEDQDGEEAKVAAEACEKVSLILRKIEGAYDSLSNLLPSEAQLSRESFDETTEDYETPVVVPDLLPPCTTQRGDATLAFFRACVGDSGEEERKPTSAGEMTREPSSDSMEAGQGTEQPSSKQVASSPGKQGSSVFSSMFKRGQVPSTNTGGLFGTFRKRGQRGSSAGMSDERTASNRSFESADSSSIHTRPGEYGVKIEREMLGLTVENVLERTVVRTVLAGGPAKKAGARVGSLIVKVGNVETRNLTHFETIDELRQSQRPLNLVLRHVSDDALRSAREEMGRLIRGSGFGTILDGHRLGDTTEQEEEEGEVVRPLIGNDLRIDAFTNMLKRRFAEVNPQARNKKEEALARVGEKLVWILTLFVIGLEREASRLFVLASASNDPSASPRRNPHSLYHHSAKDYSDAAKSLSKVLLDFTRKRLDAQPSSPGKSRSAGFIQHSLDTVGGPRRGKKGQLPPPPPPQMAGRGRRQIMLPGAVPKENTSMIHEKPLLQIGDVLQRARTFLADTTSPPAALLRGEVIAFLCDVLDLDSDMELSEEDALTATAGAGAQAGPINDLGSAGSLLKLIILNCPIMRSPGCEDASLRDESVGPELEEELKRRFGSRQEFSTVDLHKLHAGNRFLAVVHRLAASRSTSARITACSLGPVIWGHLDFPHQLQLRGVITRALHDVEVIVRRATATVLHEIAELVFDPRCVPWLVLMCERAMTDPEPQLRSAAMTLTWHLAEHLPNAFLGDASQGSRYLRRLPNRNDPIFADVYLLQCKLLPVATRLAEDRSPSVRLAVAAQCDRLCDALGDHWSSVIIDVLLALLSDSDERVRCEAVMCVPRLANIVLLSTSPGESSVSEVSVLEALVPASTKLQKNTSASVRVSLAAAAGELLTLFVALQKRSDDAMSSSTFGERGHSERSHDTEGGRHYKKQVDERLIPLVQKLLNDSDPEVTSAALRAVTNASRRPTTNARNRHLSVASEDDSVSISSYQSHASKESRQPVFLPVLSEVQVLRLLPTLTELANSKQWRVRQSAVEIVPALLGCTSKLETRSEISKLCVRLMGDSVDAVRKTAAECLCMGGSSLGSHGEDAAAEWITSIVIPAIRRCAVHTLSKQRLLSLKMVEVILLNGECPSKWKGTDIDRMTDSPIRELAAIALSLTGDRIANVRLNVGRVLECVLDQFEEEELSFIKEVLIQQVESEKEREGGGDRDVLFFANRCINRAKILLEDRSMSHEEATTALI